MLDRYVYFELNDHVVTVDGPYTLLQGPDTFIRSQKNVPCYYSAEAKNQQQMDFQHTLPIAHLNVDTVTIR